mmetsp:Transcript_11554/g.17432  ORF Transcript_11554/g.17432 Transcript_11554/m.17432 type:complete len:112 (+) Transcript_11554:614-949(+)
MNPLGQAEYFQKAKKPPTEMKHYSKDMALPSPNYLSYDFTKEGGIKLKRFEDMGYHLKDPSPHEMPVHKASVYELIFQQKIDKTGLSLPKIAGEERNQVKRQDLSKINNSE